MSDDPDFPLCAGDGLPILQETLQNGDGTTPDLTGASVSLVIQDANHTQAAFGGPSDIIGDPKAAVVRYTWTADDVTTLQTIGRWFNYRWVVTFPGSTLPETFPNGTCPRRLLVSPRT